MRRFTDRVAVVTGAARTREADEAVHFFAVFVVRAQPDGVTLPDCGHSGTASGALACGPHNKRA